MGTKVSNEAGLVKYQKELARKEKFVTDNAKLHEEAFIEFRTHKKGQRLGPKMLAFLKKARKKFKYSDRTAHIDVWTKFQFPSINHRIDARLKAEHLQKPGIKKALGYGQK